VDEDGGGYARDWVGLGEPKEWAESEGGGWLPLQVAGGKVLRRSTAAGLNDQATRGWTEPEVDEATVTERDGSACVRALARPRRSAIRRREAGLPAEVMRPSTSSGGTPAPGPCLGELNSDDSSRNARLISCAMDGEHASRELEIAELGFDFLISKN